MKRTENRKAKFLATGIILILIASMLPISAMAKVTLPGQGFVNTIKAAYSDPKDVFAGYKPLIPFDPQKIAVPEKGMTITVPDDEKTIRIGEELYDFSGIATLPKDLELVVTKGAGSLKIPPFPTTAENEAELAKARQKWVNDYGFIVRGYIPHSHDCSDCPWIASPTNHWKICRKCRQDCEMSWHWDNNKDGLCDVCGYKVPYHPIDVKPSAGGRIEVSQEKALLGDVITVKAVPDAGYHLKEVHFYNLNDMHSELTRYEDKKGEAYHFQVLPWDVEIESVFEKD